MANRPIPITANTDENTTASSFASAPKINASISKAIKNKVTVTYREINLIRASLIPLLRPIFLIRV